MTDPENMNLILISEKNMDLRVPIIAFKKVKHKLHAYQEELLLGLNCNDFIQRNTTGSNRNLLSLRKKFIQHIEGSPDLQNSCLDEIKNDGKLLRSNLSSIFMSESSKTRNIIQDFSALRRGHASKRH